MCFLGFRASLQMRSSPDSQLQTCPVPSNPPWSMPKNVRMPMGKWLVLVLVVLVLVALRGLWGSQSWTLCPCSKSSQTWQTMPPKSSFQNTQNKLIPETRNFWGPLERKSRNNLCNLMVVLKTSNMTHQNLRMMSKNANPTCRSSN